MSNNTLICLAVVALLGLAGCQNKAEQPGPAEQTTQQQNAKPPQQEPSSEHGQEDEANFAQAPVSEKSLPDQWLEKALRAKANDKSSTHETLGQVRWGPKQAAKVVRLGTVASWANELTMDEFAVRVARYMRTMSSVTGNAYCGQICKGPGANAAPWSVDILTQNDRHLCPLVPVCSLPNGSGIKHYGEPTGNSLYIAVNRAPTGQNDTVSTLSGGAPYAYGFQFLTSDGKSVNIDLNGEDMGYYYLIDGRYNLAFGSSKTHPRRVYDFNTNAFLNEADVKTAN